MVNFYALDDGGSTELVKVITESGDIIYNIAEDEKTPLNDVVRAKNFSRFRMNSGKFLSICEIPGYPPLLSDSIEYINPNSGSIIFRNQIAGTGECPVSCNIFCFPSSTFQSLYV